MRALIPATLVVLSLAFASQAVAGVETNTWLHFTAQTVACGGELITVDTDVHLVSRVTTDANGASHLGSTITTFFKGTSASGARYVGASHQTTALQGEPNFPPTGTTTETFRQNLIRLGENGTADDLHGWAVFHVTVLPDGEIVVDHFDFTTECA